MRQGALRLSKVRCVAQSQADVAYWHNHDRCRSCSNVCFEATEAFARIAGMGAKQKRLAGRRSRRAFLFGVRAKQEYCRGQVQGVRTERGDGSAASLSIGVNRSRSDALRLRMGARLRRFHERIFSCRLPLGRDHPRLPRLGSVFYALLAPHARRAVREFRGRLLVASAKPGGGNIERQLRDRERLGLSHPIGGVSHHHRGDRAQ